MVSGEQYRRGSGNCGLLRSIMSECGVNGDWWEPAEEVKGEQA